MSEELLMQETQPEVNAETTDIEPAEAETGAKEEVAEEATPSTETEADGEAQADSTGADGEASVQANPEADPESEPEPPVVRVKFNKQVREYSIEEATPYVEMGLKYESFKPTYEKLKFIATTSGLSIPDLVDKLLETNERTVYEQILEKAGGNEEIAKELHEAKKAERQRKYQELLQQEKEREEKELEAERQAELERLANEFIELKNATDGKFAEFKDVPKAVLNLAQKRNISLLDAYLRFEHEEIKKREAAARKQSEAAKSSVGSLADTVENPSTAGTDFEKAFYQSLI